MPTVELSCDATYEAAHWLPLVPAGHKCGTIHGHSYRLTVTVRGPVGDDGFVIDYAAIKAALAPIVASLDHKTLNKVIENPTVERQLIWIWEHLEPDLPGLHELTLRETPTNSATYRGER